MTTSLVRLRRAAAIAALVAGASPAFAGSYLVFQDDQSGFTAALTRDATSTVTDTGGAFAPDPSAATGVASVTRTGTILGQTFTFSVEDVNFSNTPTGTLAVGQDVASTSTLAVETPVANGGATGTGTFGYDSTGATDSSATRNALSVNFTTTPGGAGIGHFALELVDFEAGATPGELRLYDGGSLVFSTAFTFPGPGLGNGETHFLGVVAVGSASFFDQVVLVVGDETSSPNTENWAADRFQFGVAHNPEPGSVAMFGAGLAVLAVVLRRRRAADARAPARDKAATAGEPAPPDAAVP